jgi:peptidylprolyl isomerase
MSAIVGFCNFLAISKKNPRAAVALILISAGLAPANALAAPTPSPSAAIASAVVFPKGALAPSYGIVFNPKAVKKVDIWEDFQCPKCAVFESINKANIAKLISSKTVQVNYHPLSFIGVESQRAAMVAGCAADQGKYVQAHDLLFKSQPTKENSGTWTYPYLLKKMATIGLTNTAFKKCVNTEKYAAWIATVQQSVVNTSVVATPTVVVNGIQLNRTTDYSDPAAFMAAIANPAKIVTATPTPSPTAFTLTFPISRVMGTEPTIGKPTGDAPKTLVIGDLVVGTGDVVNSGDTVAVQYVLMDWATGNILESSWKGNPATFPLSSVISAWQRGIPGMKVGGRRLLIAPPDWAYGAAGNGKVGPNANLVFVVDLLAIPSHIVATPTATP